MSQWPIIQFFSSIWVLGWKVKWFQLKLVQLGWVTADQWLGSCFVVSDDTSSQSCCLGSETNGRVWIAPSQHLKMVNDLSCSARQKKCCCWLFYSSCLHGKSVGSHGPRNNINMWPNGTSLSLAISGLAVESSVVVGIILVKKSLLNTLMHLLEV